MDPCCEVTLADGSVTYQQHEKNSAQCSVADVQFRLELKWCFPCRFQV